MKKMLFLGFFAAMAYAATAQNKFMSRNGHVWFFSKAPLEDIEGHNHQATAIIDVTTGDMAFKLIVKSFEFEKGAMQEHFNRDYLESEKFPNATFEGKITNLKDVNFSKDGTYATNVEGKMTIHGVTKDIKQSGSLIVADGKISVKAKFNLIVADYGVKIPSDFSKKIADNVDITVDVTLEPYKR